MSVIKHEPLAVKGDYIDFFDTWHAIAYHKPLPPYVIKWANRKPSHAAFLDATITMATGNNFTATTEMIEVMLHSIKDIIGWERSP